MCKMNRERVGKKGSGREMRGRSDCKEDVDKLAINKERIYMYGVFVEGQGERIHGNKTRFIVANEARSLWVESRGFLATVSGVL